jgi:Lrp/AsnC family leucine-responsive transcriptional regulator
VRKLDSTDRAILYCLQRDGRMSNHEIAASVNLSPAPCWRRIKRLEEDGIVRGYVALVDATSLGLNLTAYINISLNDHHADTVAEFDAFVAASPEVLECYSVTGEHDYLLRVVTPGIAEIEEFIMHRLLCQEAVNSANTTFVLREKKRTTALPLPRDI